MAKLGFIFDAREWESNRAAECLAEGEFSRAIEILNSNVEIGDALRKMLADMLGAKGNSVGTGLKIERRQGKGAIPKKRSNFWRNHELGEKVGDYVDRGLTVTKACAKVGAQPGVTVQSDSLKAFYYEYLRFRGEIDEINRTD